MPKSRLVYILLAVFLGGLGVHNFYAGHVGRAVAQLLTNFCLFLLSIITLGFGAVLYLGLLAWIIVDICTVTKDNKGIDFAQ